MISYLKRPRKRQPLNPLGLFALGDGFQIQNVWCDQMYRSLGPCRPWYPTLPYRSRRGDTTHRDIMESCFGLNCPKSKPCGAGLAPVPGRRDDLDADIRRPDYAAGRSRDSDESARLMVKP